MPEQDQSQADGDKDQASTDSSTDKSQADDKQQEGKGPSRQELEAELAKVRREAAQRRKNEGALQTKLQEIENAKLSESELTKKKLADIEQQLESERQARRTSEVRGEVLEWATDRKALRPQLVAKLLLQDLEYGDDGSPINLQEAGAALEKSAPELFRNARGSADGGARGGSTEGTTDMNALIRRGAGRT